jgi:hypothetical protein
MSQENDDIDALHIGNMVGIFSERYGYTVGRIAYRSDERIRVIPQEASNKAIEFPMTEDGTEFAPELGVTAIEILERQESPYYVDFLGVKPGELVEFFTADGEEAAPSGTVSEVVKTAKRDGIRLEDGRTFSFGGVGPKEPVAVVRVLTESVAAADGAGAAAVDTEAAAAAAAAAAARKARLLEMLRGVLPTETVEVIPRGERSYPDSMQREDLFQDLLVDINAKQRTNPRRIRYLEREVDVAVALKNLSVKHDDTGRILGVQPYLVASVGDALALNREPLPIALPVVKGARVLHVDELSTAEAKDVVPRTLTDVETEAEHIAELYTESALPEALGKGFDAYMMSLLGDTGSVFAGPSDTEGGWREAQDVIRTAGYTEPVQGLSKDLPAFTLDAQKAVPVDLSFLVKNVMDRSMRLLPAGVRVNARTQEETIIVGSDPSIVTQYVVLPTKAALSLRPPKRPGDLPTALLYSAALESANLPTIVKTLRDLYTTDTKSALHAWDLAPEAAAEYDIAGWLESVLRYTVHPAECLAPRTPALLSVLDAVGAGQHDMAPAVATVIHDYVAQSQRLWTDLLAERRTAIQTALDTEEARVFQSVTGTDSPLWPALQRAEPLADFLADLRERDPAIWQSPTLMTATLLHEAQGDAAPLVWATIGLMDNRMTDIDPVAAAANLTASRVAAQRRRVLRDLRLSSLKAAPEINTCPHVTVLEAVRNVGDILTRARMLREFIETYQGGREGDWMTCVLCKKPCVCYHELMELEALAQPARMDAIQRQILVQFGGDRYEGKIVCRNCGQVLRDIDYDEHVEFDDEGNPIVSSSVLTEEQMADPSESAWRKTVQALAPPELEFATPAQNAIHSMLREILKRGNILVDDSVVRTIVEQTDAYVTARTPARELYEAKRAAEMKKASGKALPAFGAFVNTVRVAAVGALLSIQMQIARPPIAVNNPMPYCGRFRREGWPLVADGDPTESGPFRYVCCVIATIAPDKPQPPWSDFTWQKESKLESRINQTLKAVLGAATIIITKNEMPFSAPLQARLATVRADATEQRAQELVSHTDQLPVGFRPEPFPAAVQRPVLEKDPVAAIRDAVTAGAPILPMVQPVVSALHQQARAVIHELHEDAVNTLTGDTCCTATITEARGGKLLGAPESAALLGARIVLHEHMPTAVNAGTHLWSDFAIPVPAPVAQEVDPGVFYKLFLKFCYRGPAVGEAHEFSVGNICRQCGLELGKSIDLIDFGTEGAAILAAQQGDLKVEASAAAFEALSTAVRRRRVLEPRAPSGAIPWREGLEAVVVAADGSYKGAMRPVATALAAVLENIAGREDVPASALERSALWEPLTEHYDRLREEIDKQLKRAPTAKYVVRAMANLDTITADPFVEGPSAVQEYWCAMTQAAGTSFTIESVNGARWFKISKEHNARINSIIRENTSWYGGDITEGARTVLRQVGRVLGPLMRTWIRVVRPSPVGGGAWNAKDAQMLLCTLVYQAWHDALLPTSWMYAGLEAADAEPTATNVAEWTTTLMIHSGRQFIKYSDDQIRTMLQKRAELERTSIVQEFDSINDPDERAAALLLKQFRIGRWARGQNIQSLDADTYEFETEQRHRMGIVDPPVDPLLLREGQGPQRETYGLGGMSQGGPEDGYAVDQGEAGAND